MARQQSGKNMTPQLRFRVGAFAIAALLFFSAISSTAFAQTTYGQTSGNAANGFTLYDAACSGCHGDNAEFSIAIRNAANAGRVINAAMTRGMAGLGAGSYNDTQENDIAAHIATLFSTSLNPANQAVPFNSAGTLITLPNIYLSTTYGVFSGISTVVGGAPARGSVTYSGFTASYVPTAGQCGTDSFTWRAQGQFDTTPGAPVVLDTYQSNNRSTSVLIANPAAPNIGSSPGTATGTFNSSFSYTPTSSGGPVLSYAITSGTLPTGVSLNPATGVISGTPSQAGTFNVTLTGRNCLNGNLTGQSNNRAITITIAQASQSITFGALPSKTTSDAPFVVSATGGASGNPVTFAASGVCTASGTNGSTISLTGVAGMCTVTASQSGNTNYAMAPNVAQSFNVVDGGAEVFPPQCQIPAGWSTPAGAAQGWQTATDFASAGVCSFKSTTLPDLGSNLSSRIAFTGNFDAGNIQFRFKVSSEPQYDCFRFLVDGVETSLIGGCSLLGGYVPGVMLGSSGNIDFTQVTVPVTAGTHTVVFSYDKDTGCCNGGLDAAWVDEVVLPLSTSITSPTFQFGTFGAPLTYTLAATNFPRTLGATGLPAGLTFNATTGVISGTPGAAGTFPVTVTASNPAGANPAASDLKTVSFIILKAAQSITFAPLNNRITTAPPFAVTATGGGSGSPVTFTASGVCSHSGTNGATISLSGAAGSCTVTASQAGNDNYQDASPIAQVFQVLTAAAEIFPPACTIPAGWVNSAGPGWAVSANEESATGACSMKSVSTTGSSTRYQTEISYAGTFAAGNVTFKYRISTEPEWKCFQFFIDSTPQNLAGSCSTFGLTGISGESGWVSVSFPISAGAHTLRWVYDKDSNCCTGGTRDAVWIDDVVMPQFTLTVNATRSGSATGTIVSTPAAINCAAPATCSSALSGSVLLTPSPGFLSVFSGWSGAGCSGTAPCTVTMDASKTVTGNFTQATPPSALQNVVATPGNGGATITFNAPASDGGSPITSYGGNCSAAGQTTVFAGGSSSPTPLVFSGMTNGVQYTCSVAAGNFAGTGPATIVTVTPRTVPAPPTGAMGTAGNTQATISFTASASNGGANISGYTATCTAAGQTTRTGTASMSPITVSSLVNGVAYSCSVVATNVAGNSTASNVISVTALTVPGVPSIISVSEFDGRVVINFTPPGSDGGSAIIDYETSCSAVGQATRVATGSGSPILVTSLTNNVGYSCTVRARNAAGFGSGTLVVVLPRVRAGNELFTEVCTVCHAGAPAVPQLNAAGTTATVLSDVITNQPSMNATPNVTSLTQPERVAIAAYLAGTISSSALTTPFNTPRAIDLSAQITLGTISFESLEVVTPPVNGTLSAFSGTSITYTPNAGYAGTDSFTFRGRRTNPTSLIGDARTVNLNVLPPPAPVITSGLTASGTNGSAFSYQIVASNSPVSYGATGLPAGLGVNAMTGAISGTPTLGGSFMSTITATNVGGTGSATLTITLNPAAQTITFPVQSPATRAYAPAPGNTFAINPLASASSGLAVTYVSKTTGICTVTGTTITMLAAGTCTIGANQSGNASFTIAAEVTRDVAITPILPGAPTIGAGTPGNLQATIAFSAPADTGGTGITGYAASCTPSGSGTGTVSPIVVAGLINGTTYSCSVRASNSVGQGPASGTVMVTPAPTPTPPTFTSAASTTFTVNAPGSFTATASGTPATFTWSQTGTLPIGITFSTSTGVLSGTPTQAGSFPLTLGVSNGVMPNASQSFTLTVAKASQTISFDNPGTRTLGAGAVALAAVATSSLAVSFVSDTPAVCTISGTNANLIAIGTCTVRAQQAGNANFNAAPDVPQSFTVLQGGQSITFGAQTTPRAFAAGGTFALSPVATASSGLAVSYSSLTTSVCTIASTTVTMVRAGICTIAANQAGNANFAAAAQATQSITITGVVPGAPTLNTATGGNNKITLAFTAPASDGGSSITSYTATCGGITGTGSGSPVTVSGLTNGMSYSCSVTATNPVGTSVASNSMMATPAASTGATIWAATCGTAGCHGSPPNPTNNPATTRLNVGGNTTTLLDYVIPRQPVMAVNPGIAALSAGDKLAVAQYIAEFIPAISMTTPHNTAASVNVSSQVFLNTLAGLTTLEVVTPPANGMVSSFTGTSATYTPNNGFVGTDTFTYRAKNVAAASGPAPQGPYDTDVRTVSITVLAAAPAITSALTVSATVNQAFTYQIAATNAPTGYNATGLPAWLGVNTTTGVLSGMPPAGATAMVTISASNANGSGSAALTINIGTIAQTITFGAQASPIAFNAGAVVMISPAATGGASGNPIVYSSLTPSVCSVSGATWTILSAGICTIAANQAGAAAYSAAPQVTQSISINGAAPDAPTIGTALAGNTQATVNFTAPANTGGLPITSYTANCGGISASGSSSPIVVSGLVNGVSYLCTVTATNAAGTSVASAGASVTPVAAAFTGTVLSRKTHGVAGTFDLAIDTAPAIGGAVTVESRAIGAGHQIVFQFSDAISAAGTVSVVNAAAMPVGSASAMAAGNEVIVTVTGIPDNSRATVTLTGVNGGISVAPVSIGFLVGDVNNSRSVNATDISGIKARSGQAASASNFRFDLNASGGINATDIAAVKARSGLVLP
jgi:mono/diheme cytochrome c family protein